MNEQVLEKKSVYFVSLGCPKNLVDSQVMLGKLQQDEYQITQGLSKASDEARMTKVCSC